MTINTEWTITRFNFRDKNGLTKVAEVLHYSCTAYDADGGNVTENGAIDLGEPVARDFIPFDKLTKTVCMMWIPDRVVDAVNTSVVAKTTSRNAGKIAKAGVGMPENWR